MITWCTGNSKSGKSTLARQISRDTGAIILDGDKLRQIWHDLDLSEEGRWEQNMRAARLAKMLDEQGFNVVVATICPYRKLREEVRRITGCRFIYLDGGLQGPDYPYEQ